MSEQTQVNKGKQNKGLGRGLGSLLGPTNEGAFSKTTPVADKAIEALTKTIEKSQTDEPAMKEGFVEKTEPAQPVVQAAPVAPAVEPAAPAVPANARIWQIGIEKIEPNPNQPRQIFDKEPLQELADSIKEKGIIQPLLVRKRGDGFEIIAGERRWRAAQIAGLKEVPAIIRDSEDQETLELALIENIQRQNLNPVEEAEAYDYLIRKYNLTQADLAQKVGKDRATVANLLRVLQLQPGVRQMVSSGELSLGLAKVLMSVTDQAVQAQLAKRAKDESLSVRALEKLVARMKEPAPTVVPIDEKRAHAARVLGEELQKLIGSKVELDYDNGKGRIQIHFYSDQELNQIVDTLRDAWRS